MKASMVLLMGVMGSALASAPPHHQLRAVTRSLLPHMGQLRALLDPASFTLPPAVTGTKNGTCSAGAAAVGSCCTDGTGQPNSQFSIAGFDAASLNDCYEFLGTASIRTADNIVASVNTFYGLTLGSSASSLAIYTADLTLQAMVWIFAAVEELPSLSSSVSSVDASGLAAAAASGKYTLYTCIDFPAQDPAAFLYASPPTGGATSASGLPTSCHALDSTTLAGASIAVALSSGDAAVPGTNIAAMSQTEIVTKYVAVVDSLLRSSTVNSQPVTSACGCGAGVAATAVILSG